MLPKMTLRPWRSLILFAQVRSPSSLILAKIDHLFLVPAVDYTSVYYAQDPATLTAIATGAADTDASFVSTSTVKPGQNAGSPPDSTQGATYQVDHIVELQFLVGAFSVNARP